MGEEEGVINVMPVEKTIIDPLYEPLKLNRYELCEHLQRLKDVSHLRYGFSPYLLFDVCKTEMMIKKINPEKEHNKPLKKYIKKFEDLLEHYLRFLEHLKDIEKRNRNEYIKLLVLCSRAIRDMHTAIKVLFDVFGIENRIRGIEREVITADIEQYIEKINNIIEECKKLEAPFNTLIEKLEKLQSIEDINEFLKESINAFESIEKEIVDFEEHIRKIKEYNREVRGEYSEIKEYFRKPRDSNHLENKKKFYEVISEHRLKLSPFLQLAYPVKVKCPLCEKEAKTTPYMFMCEEGKIYSLKEALLRTFELRRARWLYMSGSLHTVHRASTHTRLSHQIGSMLVAVNALREIDVFTSGDISMSLEGYLLLRGELYEFLAANFLHDIGHSPLSHVLEPNPFIELDHEEITRNLIFGERTKKEKEAGMDWYVTERYLLKMKAIKDFEYRFFENRYDPIYYIPDKDEIEKEKGKGKTESEIFLDCLDKNNEILESEIVTVKEVLDNFGIVKERVVEFLTGVIFCPECKRLFAIKSDKEKIKCECGEYEERSIVKIYSTQFLNKLIDSEIDIDRVDHVRRDSEICGLSLTSFRLFELLGSISVVLPDSWVYNDVYGSESDEIKSPYIFISEDGLSYVMDLLNSRRAIYNNVMFSDENNWINGAVNQITALAVRYLPHLTNMLPFITDQILAHFYTNDLFLGTQIEKLNRLFHGRSDCSAYRKPMRYKLREGVIVTEDDLEEMYKAIEKINDSPEYAEQELPAVVFYTNVKEATKCRDPDCNGELEYVKICPECKGALNEEEGKIKCVNCNKFIEPKEVKEELIRCKKCGVFYLADVEKDLKNLSKCTSCGSEEIKMDEERNFLECEDCKKRMRKWSEKNWDDMLVYGKKFKIDSEEKYFKFKELVGKYNDASRERFPARPSELDVKNLFYVWVSDFCDETQIMNAIRNKIERFDKIFVDLDEKEVTS